MPGRQEIDTELGTYSDDLPDADLFAESDICDETVQRDIVRNGDKANNTSGHASTTSHLGRTTVHRRPPRPTHSGTLGTKPLVATAQPGGTPKVQGGGSVHRRRTGRRGVATEKHWGNASMPAITVRDIMGSEKKATAVGIVGADHSRLGESSRDKDSKSGAEEKRSMIRSRWNEKRSRQSNVKNSLAQFLKGEQSGESDDGYLEEVGDEEMISDDEELHRHASAQSLNFVEGEDSDDGASVKSSKSQSRNLRSRRSSTIKTDGNSTDGDIPGSSQSGGRRGTRRQRKSDAADDDDRSVGSRGRRTSRRTSTKHGSEQESLPLEHVDREESRRIGHSHEGQKRSLSAPRRPVSSKPRSTRKKASGDDDDRSVGSRKAVGTRRRKPPSGDDDDRSVGSKKSHARRRKPTVDDDDRSIGSKKSVGGRRRRHQSTRTKTSASREDAPSSPKPKTAEVLSGSPPVSPLGSRPNSTSSMVEATDKLSSLALHIEANPQSKTSADPEERSEESSRFSASYEQPQSLIQFDPTNPNNITMVRQDKANFTSEKIRHADGTESELHIAALAGLPTFENSPPNFNESMSSVVSETDKRPQSARSEGSIELSDGEVHRASAKSMSHIGYSPKKAGIGHKNEEADGGTHPVNAAGRSRHIAESRSFLARRRKKTNDNGEKQQKSASQDSTFQESVKGFFGGWNKKGECESGDEDDDLPKGNRFFRKREEVEHQALDDDGSDEN